MGESKSVSKKILDELMAAMSDTEADVDKTTTEVLAGLIWHNRDDDSYMGAVKDIARTLVNCTYPENGPSYEDVVKYAGEQLFFTRFLLEHVLKHAGLEATQENAWDLQRALLELACDERGDEE